MPPLLLQQQAQELAAISRSYNGNGDGNGDGNGEGRSSRLTPLLQGR